MISIIEHIEYLMLRHDCVVVPGLGAFIAHHTAARIDRELGCIFPPRRSVTFNPELTHNDGLLVSSVARRHALVYEQAAQVVADCVAAMRYQLRQEGETGIGHLGVLSRTAEGAMAFEPYEGATVAPRYVGLAAVKALPLSADNAATPESAETTEYPAVASPYRRLLRNMLQAVAMAAVLTTLGLMLSTPIVDNRAARASMAPAIAPTAAYADELRALDERTRTLTLSMAMPVGADAETTLPAAMRCEAADRYCLVVASLPSVSKAAEYVAAHPYGYEMHMLEADGRCRLYVATGPTFAAAQSLMATAGFADRYPQAWVCRR